ncbi:sensor histidine kinase [Actinosynnema mirum]|uniref:Histidine kinase n=2 Tax=Actinosynnema TaxID=40566 RepID=C6WFF1_ACTMD|nr:histidine kinase [Actinosynnema mirum]ACU35886.1 histidine kinase [Actinosynnema mirum DSM 43827]AXX29310.1 sensor histidine kinase [Actinosynnema pretiosum subsp. pretiosum]
MHRSERAVRRWLLIGLALVAWFVPTLVVDLLEADLPPAQRVAAVALVVGYGIALTAPLPARRRLTEGRQALLVGALVAWGLLVIAVTGLDSAVLLVHVLGTASIVLPARLALTMNGTAAAALVAGLLWRAAGSGQPVHLVAALGSLVVGFAAVVRLVRTRRELARARVEIAALAAAEERHRLGRDLHDILGHSLTTVTVKAGLARRLLERGEVERALGEVGELETLARQALGDVRATVGGYREVALAGELVAARSALRAAGIEADLPSAVDNVAPELQGVFGYVLREAVTNVLRHSAARTCSVRLGARWIEVVDDGRGAGAGQPGSGVAGLRERLAEIGGALEAGPVAGGYRLRAEVRDGGTA